jgi:aminoacylase
MENGSSTSTTIKGKAIPSLSSDDAEAAIRRFQQFLTFETVSRTAPETGAYRACAEWLVSELEKIPVLQESRGGGRVFLLPEAPEHSPVVVACWKGTDESLPVILLNSHYDVVPVTPAWTRPAWEGHRENGRIYGRGTQDMKCVCMQYIEAIRRLSSSQNGGWKPSRSIYLTFVPDEGTNHDKCV